MTKQEEFQNRALAMLLRERGVQADFEQRGGRKRMEGLLMSEHLAG